MSWRVQPNRPWLKLGRHVYLPCADPHGHCIKLNPHASLIWMRWMERAGQVAATTPERQLAERLAAQGVAVLTPIDDDLGGPVSPG